MKNTLPALLLTGLTLAHVSAPATLRAEDRDPERAEKMRKKEEEKKSQAEKKLEKERDKQREKEQREREQKEREYAEAAKTDKQREKEFQTRSVVWKDKAIPGEPVTMRMMRENGKADIYEGQVSRQQTADNSYNAEDKFYLTVLCAGQDGDMDLLAFRRTYTDRKRTEKYENGKTIERALSNTDDLVNLGPNFNMVGALRCHACDALNRIAYRTSQILRTANRTLYGNVLSQNDKSIVFMTGEDRLELATSSVTEIADVPVPHVMINDTPHYLFPLLPSREVKPGDEWRFKMPVIIPIEQGASAKILPTQFNLSFVGRLRSVKNAALDKGFNNAQGKIAEIDYQFSGEFDSNKPENLSRFPSNFANTNKIVHRVTGEGSCTFDVTHGRILQKSESVQVYIFAGSELTDASGKTRQDQNRADVSSRFSIKRMPPGTKLSTGMIVPE